METRDLDMEYEGETAPRHRFVAAMLTALHPTLGYLYVGQSGRAWAAALGFTLYLGIFVGTWAALQFFPLLPFVTFVLGWVIFVSLCMWDVLQESQKQGATYLLRSFNHPMIYGLVYMVIGLAPLHASWYLSTNVLWSVVQVNDLSMYPSLLPGDIVLVDRMAYQEATPKPGDEVLTQSQEAGGSVSLSRVLAAPGDTYHLMGDNLYLNKTPLARSFYETENHTNILAGDPTLPSTRLYLEENKGQKYVIAALLATPPKKTEVATVPEEQLLLAGDNRTRIVASPPQTRPIATVLGKPRFILYSASQDTGKAPESRWDRVGLRIE